LKPLLIRGGFKGFDAKNGRTGDEPVAPAGDIGGRGLHRVSTIEYPGGTCRRNLVSRSVSGSNRFTGWLKIADTNCGLLNSQELQQPHEKIWIDRLLETP
jgi:hypothetical protein